MLVGSPEWFELQSQTKRMQQNQSYIEDLRKSFLEKFSPEKLAAMSGEELLTDVFGNNPDAMIPVLLLDKDYVRFGSAGKYIFNTVVYKPKGNTWKYKEGNLVKNITDEEALASAISVRDQLLEAVNIIKSTDLSTLSGYELLEKKLSHIFFADYAWTVKYFQMNFPYYFVGMYNNNVTLKRAIKILGLEFHGSHKLLNIGEVSLFVRRCGINNITFGTIYGEEWGWEGNRLPCPSAIDNYNGRSSQLGKLDLSLYKLPTNDLQKRIQDANDIEDEIEQLNLQGEVREAIVKLRVNQGIFRDNLIKRYKSCCLCGVTEPKVLIASHIKPWADSEPSEKLDPNNGFLLCANHDKLFDQGYITFDDNGMIQISSQISSSDQQKLNIHSSMYIQLTNGNKKYLEHHRKHIFKK